MEKVEQALLIMLGAISSLFKSVYFPLIFLNFLLPRTSFRSSRNHLGYLLTVVAFTVGMITLWSYSLKDLIVPTVIGNDFSAQKYFVLSHPIQVTLIITKNLYTYWFDYLRMLVGQLGWLETFLPNWLVTANILFLLMIALLDNNVPLRHSDRCVLCSIIVLGIFLVGLAIYVTGMPVGANELLGIQGRYFTPYAALGIALVNQPHISKWSGWQVPVKSAVVAVSLFSCGALYAVWNRYY